MEVASLYFSKYKEVFRRVRLFIKGKEQIVIQAVEDAGPYGVKLLSRLVGRHDYGINLIG